MWSDLKDLSYREASEPWGSQCCKTYFKPPDQIEWDKEEKFRSQFKPNPLPHTHSAVLFYPDSPRIAWHLPTLVFTANSDVNSFQKYSQVRTCSASLGIPQPSGTVMTSTMTVTPAVDDISPPNHCTSMPASVRAAAPSLMIAGLWIWSWFILILKWCHISIFHQSLSKVFREAIFRDHLLTLRETLLPLPLIITRVSISHNHSCDWHLKHFLFTMLSNVFYCFLS